MTADEMFEELGYKKHETKHCESIFYFDDNVAYFSHPFTIEIIKDRKLIMKYVECDDYLEADALTIEELKAINQKCKELGWLK